MIELKCVDVWSWPDEGRTFATFECLANKNDVVSLDVTGACRKPIVGEIYALRFDPVRYEGC